MNRRRTGLLFVVAAALLWSTGGIGIKAVPEPPLVVAFYRSFFAAITLLLIFRRRAMPRRWSATFWMAVLCYATCLPTFVAATKWTTAANAIFLQYAGVIWVMLFSPILLHEPIRARDAIAIAAALGGMALFFVGRFEMRGATGNEMALLSSVFFAGLILALRHEHEGAQAAITWGNIVLAAGLLPLVRDDLALTPRSFAVLLFLGVFQIAIAYLFFVRGLASVTATEASLTGMLEPISNPLWVFLFLGERPSPYALAGGAIVLAAIGWHTMRGEAPAEIPAPD